MSQGLAHRPAAVFELAPNFEVGVEGLRYALDAQILENILAIGHGAANAVIRNAAVDAVDLSRLALKGVMPGDAEFFGQGVVIVEADGV